MNNEVAQLDALLAYESLGVWEGESILDDFGDWEFLNFCGDLFDLCSPAIVRHTDSGS